ncbi:uracil-DNA glycosylase [Aeribacillus pallidus]
MNKVNCFQCRFFYVTWDPIHPRGCKAYSFKSKAIPSQVVLHASGQPCLKFIKKQK